MSEKINRGLCFILVGPSGSGKTTLSDELILLDKNFKPSISMTTRLPREGEKNGVSYHFIDKPEFEKMLANNEFLEFAKVFDNYYGTPKKQVDDILNSGKDLLLVLDWQGHLSFQKALGDDVVGIFLMPENINILKERLIKRGDNLEDVKKRFSNAMTEINHSQETKYIIKSDNKNKVLKQALEIIHTERSNKIKCKLKY